MARDNGYHRENLRSELIGAAQAFVAAEGHATLSVRALAQLVGVSPGAPYHHFPDRRSLLLAVALAGFDMLIGNAAGIVASTMDEREKLVLLGRAFLQFAEEHPRLIDLMYESELTRPRLDETLKEKQTSGYRVLAITLSRLIPSASDKEISVRVVGMWSALYGFATLRNKSMLVPLELPLEGTDIAALVVEQAVAAALA